jgi:hypothetical protein
VTEPAWLAWTGSVGITLIVATGKVLRPLREALVRRAATRWLGTLLSCCMCVGFWVGLATGWRLGHRTVAEILWCGGAVSLMSYTADLILRRLGAGHD